LEAHEISPPAFSVLVAVPLATIAWVTLAALIKTKSSLIVDIKIDIAGDIKELHEIRAPFASNLACGVLDDFASLGMVILVDAVA
jgi:hypothetical protein